MVASSLVEPEFVAHLFAPLDGPGSVPALRSVRRLWRACGDQLGMDQPIVETGLSADLPPEFAGLPDGAVAARQDTAAQFQIIARHEHDLLNVSFAIAAPDAVPRPRPAVAASAASGWHEFTRWWRAVGGDAPLLGSVGVYLAKAGDPTGVPLRNEVPERADDADRWWDNGFALGGFAAWEITPAGPYASRRLVLLADPEDDVALSGLAWSDGGTSMPPLCRYLMHAAKLRYQARVRGDGLELARLQRQAAGRIDEITDLLRGPDGGSRAAARATQLSADEAELAGSLSLLRQMQRTVEIARSNMAAPLPAPLPADAALADWLTHQLADDAEYLLATHEQAGRLREVIVPHTEPHRTAVPEQREPPTTRDVPPAAVEYRVGFGIDIESYSSRSTPKQVELQSRLAGMVEQVLAGLGVPLEETDRQQGGDGVMAVLPPRVQAHEALPKLLHGWRAQAAADSGTHPGERMRLRLSIGSGPFTPAQLGFSGQTMIEIGRMLDSAELRQALGDHPDSDVVALVADRVHRDVVVEQYPGVTAEEFERVELAVKSYSGAAWLWTGGRPRSRRDRSEPRADPEAGKGEPDPQPVPEPRSEPEKPYSAPASRDVFVIYGRHGRARAAFFSLLRALDLRPLEQDQVVELIGTGAPTDDEILEAGFRASAGVVVLLTPGDVDASESDVVFQAAQALHRQPDRTILVEVGPVPRIAPLARRARIRLDSDEAHDRTVFVQRVAQRLRLVGYPVDTEGRDWQDSERFGGLV